MDKRWIRGKALRTVYELRGFQVGDEVLVRPPSVAAIRRMTKGKGFYYSYIRNRQWVYRKTVLRIVAIDTSDPRATLYLVESSVGNNERMFYIDFCAWRHCRERWSALHRDRRRPWR